ncbi:hypothetical protein COY95_02070 [Candidatus Woesearchaeota archaeon CG_4_10_14_0_8_um_filter_47_5]|nr:MAG: hypothetical protein COY95_02070 [Candidatus Woesearchaeota archaeon CG_4_10_14_0_8_um_filter_47_5]
MVTNKRSKNSRQRGSQTHGWGSKKKHRGAGNRGGRGRAGTGKRADSQKPSIWKDPDYFGKHGFKKKGAPAPLRTINLCNLESSLVKLRAEGKVQEEKGAFHIDLKACGYEKLLGTGIIHHTYNITCTAASAKACAKVEEKGGSVVILGTPGKTEKTGKGLQSDAKAGPQKQQKKHRAEEKAEEETEELSGDRPSDDSSPDESGE